MRSIRVFNDHARRRVRKDETIKLGRTVLMSEGVSDADINLVFVNDRSMLRLNRAYLRSRRRTDVISFPLDEEPRCVDGEVYVNLDQARRQARQYGVTSRQEVARLVVHGILHLIGYRDSTPSQRRAMTRLEDRYIASVSPG